MHPYLQLGHIHIPTYGIFAAVGLMAALALSHYTARYAHLSPEAVWNAGMTAILSAFVISRLLLIAFNLKSFLQYPLLILALPSLTTLGIVITALFMLAYTRWRKLQLLPLLDAASPCAALLWAFLSLGRYFEGTRDGMPGYLLWPPHKATIHPVEIYTVIAASLIFLILVKTVRTASHTAAIALIISGLAIFFIDFFRLPSELFDRFPLEGSQIIGIVMILVGAALLLRAQNEIKRESGNEPLNAI